MSLSHKSSFETVVVEKACDDLQFLAKPNLFRKDLDLKALSNSAQKSFATLKRWQQAAACNDHPLAFSTINKIIDFSDDCYHMIKLTLTAAQKGHSFAANVSTFCDALTRKSSSLEQLDDLLLKLNALAEKGYGRSIEAHGKLICLRVGLSQVSENIPSVVAKIEEHLIKSQAQDPDMPLNGVNTTFVTLPTRFQTSYNGVVVNADSDDEDAAVSSTWNPVTQTYSTSYPWLSFQNVSTQLNRIGEDISQMVEHVGRCVEWWSRMKAGLETLKAELPKAAQDGPRSLQMLMGHATDGWNEVADQFSLYVYKTSPIITDYIPYTRPRIYPPTPPRAWTPPPRSYSPDSPIIYDIPLPPVDSEKPQSFWKRLSCIS